MTSSSPRGFRQAVRKTLSFGRLPSTGAAKGRKTLSRGASVSYANFLPVRNGKTLQVDIVRARGLNKISFVGSAPFCVCEVHKGGDDAEPHAAFQTKPAKSLEADWNETSYIDGWEDGDRLYFVVCDKGVKSASVQGKADVSNSLFDPDGFAGELDLYGGKQTSATLYVRIKYALPAMELDVMVVSATNLETMNGEGTYCYCEVKHKDKREQPSKFSTKLVSKSLNPEWKESHTLQDWRAGEALEFTIYDKGKTNNAVEGRVLVPSEKFYPQAFDGDFQIEGLANGRLHLCISVGQAEVQEVREEDEEVPSHRKSARNTAEKNAKLNAEKEARKTAEEKARLDATKQAQEKDRMLAAEFAKGVVKGGATLAAKNKALEEARDKAEKAAREFVETSPVEIESEEETEISSDDVADHDEAQVQILISKMKKELVRAHKRLGELEPHCWPKRYVALDSDPFAAAAAFENKSTLQNLRPLDAMDECLIKLHELGVQGLNDIYDLKIEDFDSVGITRVHARRMQRLAQTCKLAPLAEDGASSSRSHNDGLLSCLSKELFDAVGAGLDEGVTKQLRIVRDLDLLHRLLLTRHVGGKTVLHVAASHDHVKIAQTLLDRAPHPGSLLLAGDRRGWSPLHIAVRSGLCDMTRLLLKAAPDRMELLHRRSNDGEMAVHMAVTNDTPATLRILMDEAPDLDALLSAEDDNGHTARNLVGENRELIEVLDEPFNF